MRVIPHERLRADRRHSLDGKMHGQSVDSIYAALMWEPPTSEQLVELALEEMRRPAWMGGDRTEVYLIFHEHKPR